MKPGSNSNSYLKFAGLVILLAISVFVYGYMSPAPKSSEPRPPAVSLSKQQSTDKEAKAACCKSAFSRAKILSGNNNLVKSPARKSP